MLCFGTHSTVSSQPIVFSAPEAFNVHRTSPKQQLMMHKNDPISYLWSISSKRRNKLQHILNGNIDMNEIQEFCKKLKFNDIPNLVVALNERFPKPTKWSTRADNSKTRSWLSTVASLMDLISGGESEQLWVRYISKRPTLKSHLSKNIVDEVNQKRLKTLRNNYKIIMPQLIRQDEYSEILKDNMLMLVSDVLTKEELLSAGCAVGEKSYANSRKYLKDEGKLVIWPKRNDHKLRTLQNNQS
jgi:hypothetical protein